TPTSTPGSYTLSLHDALPIFFAVGVVMCLFYGPILAGFALWRGGFGLDATGWGVIAVSTVLKTGYALFLQRAYRSGDFSFVYPRSEEHTSELQSRENLVCRLL